MSGIIEFDVGGTIIKTTIETIKVHKNSKLYDTIKRKEKL